MIGLLIMLDRYANGSLRSEIVEYSVPVSAAAGHAVSVEYTSGYLTRDSWDENRADPKTLRDLEDTLAADFVRAEALEDALSCVDIQKASADKARILHAILQALRTPNLPDNRRPRQPRRSRYRKHSSSQK